MDQEQFDSVPDLIALWENNCDEAANQIKARLLYVIALNEYSTELWDTFLADNIDLLQRTLDLKRWRKSLSNTYNEIDEIEVLDGKFDDFCTDYSEYLLGYTDLKPSEILILNFLAERDTFFYQMLTLTDPDSSIFASRHWQVINEVMPLSDPFIRFSAALWDPRGRSEILGKHPQLSLEFGEWNPKWGWEGQLDMRGGKANDSFDFRKKKDWDFRTKNYTGVALTGLVTYNISNKYVTPIHLKLGMGWDALITDIEHPDFIDSTVYFTANSPSIVGGLEWSSRIKPNRHVSVSYQVHWMNYSLGNRTNLNGFAHSFRIGYGFVGNERRTRTLSKRGFDPFLQEAPFEKK
jgi:hypothetical protein